MRPCAHIFHELCILEFSRTIGTGQRDLPCPICRLSANDLMQQELSLLSSDRSSHAVVSNTGYQREDGSNNESSNNAETSYIAANPAEILMAPSLLLIVPVLQQFNASELPQDCRRQGCLYHHLRTPRRHGYCCNACRNCESVHTQNCEGRGRTTTTQASTAEHQFEVTASLADQLPQQCRRIDCPYHHAREHRRHGYCCNACRNSERCHTNNCTGRGVLIIADTLTWRPQNQFS